MGKDHGTKQSGRTYERRGELEVPQLPLKDVAINDQMRDHEISEPNSGGASMFNI